VITSLDYRQQKRDVACRACERLNLAPGGLFNRLSFVLPVIIPFRNRSTLVLTIDAEYTSLSAARPDDISVFKWHDAIYTEGFDVDHPTPQIICRTFETYKNCIEIAMYLTSVGTIEPFSVSCRRYNHDYRAHFYKGANCRHVYLAPCSRSACQAPYLPHSLRLRFSRNFLVTKDSNVDRPSDSIGFPCSTE
jgi:hypothetical protein